MFPLLLWFLLASSIFAPILTSDSDWTRQCNVCYCTWVSGRRTADCSSRGLQQIPKDISNVVREIDFSDNSLHTLSDDEFVSANLIDIHKLKFQNCSIDTIAEGAFRRLALLIELDLTRNSIRELKANTFKDNGKLRIIILSYNKIKVIEDGLFNNMSHIQRIHVDHNEIEYISDKTFYSLRALTDISLGFNRLKTIQFDLKPSLPKLNSLNVENNPWVCDCNLEIFRMSLLKNNLLTQITRCEEPPKLKGKDWTTKETFPCPPVIIDPQPSTMSVTTSNITLTCKVVGEPEPDISWTNNGHIVENDSRKSKLKYLTNKSKSGDYTFSNLTIFNLNNRDRGEYKCVARNPGGEDQMNISLFIDNDSIDGSVMTLGNSSLLIISLCIGLVILIVIILFLVYIFCKRFKNMSLTSKQRDLSSSSEECINMTGQFDAKTVIMTDVNPVIKPPRAVPGSEVRDTKRIVLDNESVFDGDDESRSFDFEQPLLQRTRLTSIEQDYRHNPNYPPDLLSFPHRQISPAGSNASTVVIDRLPQHVGPQSPIHSPIYDQLSIYKTLPYSRSHSPFTQGVGVPRIPKQGAGYVTIPRRPRQSWSSEPPVPSDVVAEPLYDNLGVRSTVDGSSALSLNKIGAETSTPRSNRFLPKSSTPIDPILESHESSANRVEAPHEHSATLPRQSLMVKPKPQPSPKVSAVPKQVSRTLPRKLNSSMPLQLTEQWHNDEEQKRNSIASDHPMGEVKVKKIPPRPPPKPKKRDSGPVFEDECEDGTEV